MIGTALMLIVSMAMASALINQQRETQSLEERLAAIDVGRSLSQFLSGTNTCTTMFDPVNLFDPSSITFNPTDVSETNPQVIQMKGIGLDSAGNYIVQEGQKASPLSNSLKVMPRSGNGVRLIISNLTPPTASLEVNFDQTMLVRGVKNIKMPIMLSVNPVGTNVTIIGCSNADSSKTVRTVNAGYDRCFCGANEVRTGCAGTQTEDYDILAIEPNGCRGERPGLIQCLCLKQ